jgi:hypothetical protein
MAYAEGGKYSGQWEDGVPNGKGHLIYADGRELVGHFQNGKYDGD